MKTRRNPENRKTRLIGVLNEANPDHRCPCRTEVHQAEYGNFNYILVDVPVGQPRKGPAGSSDPIVHDEGPVFTVFTKSQDCGRGEYAEELDIQLGQGQFRHQKVVVKRIAELVLRHEYEAGLTVSKIVSRFGLYA